MHVNYKDSKLDNIKPHRGKKIWFLGMKLDFSEKSTVNIDIVDYENKIIN